MKKTLFLAHYLLFLLFISCSEDQQNPLQHNETHPQIFSGSIENWNLGSGYIVKLNHTETGKIFTVDSSDIDDNGDFSISDPPAPSINSGEWQSVKQFYCHIGGALDNISLSNWQAVRCSLNIEVFDQQDNRIGFLYKSSYPYYQSESKRLGDFHMYFWYINQAVEITGNSRCISELTIHSGDTTYIRYANVNYSLSLTKGYNKHIHILTEYSKSENPTIENYTYNYTTEEPVGGKWFFYKY